jgi:Sec-independent protein translocase protein TatA
MNIPVAFGRNKATEILSKAGRSIGNTKDLQAAINYRRNKQYKNQDSFDIFSNEGADFDDTEAE